MRAKWWVGAPSSGDAGVDAAGGAAGECAGTMCGTDCVDLNTDINHCGQCAAVCSDGVCVEGHCE